MVEIYLKCLRSIGHVESEDNNYSILLWRRNLLLFPAVREEPQRVAIIFMTVYLENLSPHKLLVQSGNPEVRIGLKVFPDESVVAVVERLADDDALAGGGSCSELVQPQEPVDITI